MEQNGTQMKFILDMLQGLPGKSAENASPPVCLFSIFYHLFTNALVLAQEEKKQQQKNNRAYTDIAPVKRRIRCPCLCAGNKYRGI